MSDLVRRYRLFLILLAVNIALLFLSPAAGRKALTLTGANLLEMLSFLPPVFILLGLLDVWVDRETMMKYLGEKSGCRGMLLAFFLGSAAAGPLYAAFPMVGVMIKKGAGLRNIFIFIGAWSTTKIPLLLFESATLGFRFTTLRFVFNVAGIFIIALVLEKYARRSPLRRPSESSPFLP